MQLLLPHPSCPLIHAKTASSRQQRSRRTALPCPPRLAADRRGESPGQQRSSARPPPCSSPSLSTFPSLPAHRRRRGDWQAAFASRAAASLLNPPSSAPASATSRPSPFSLQKQGGGRRRRSLAGQRPPRQPQSDREQRGGAPAHPTMPSLSTSYGMGATVSHWQLCVSGVIMNASRGPLTARRSSYRPSTTARVGQA